MKKVLYVRRYRPGMSGREERKFVRLGTYDWWNLEKVRSRGYRSKLR